MPKEQSLTTNWLQPNIITLLNKIHITIYFENLTVELYIFTFLIQMLNLYQLNIIYYMIYKFIFYA